MQAKCRKAIAAYKMLQPGESVVVGLSGGADSCALLHCLCSLREEMNLSLLAVHVNHGIRGEEASRDAAFAQALCREWDVAFRLYEYDVPRIAAEKGMGVEECGRTLRYECFEREARLCNAKIATAHTLSDSVETMLFHMIRGCTVNGLRGIPPMRGRLIRPLILCERQDIEAYCAVYGLTYMTDSTNLSADYTRNKIRLKLLPLMREINPSVTRALERLAKSAADDDDYLDTLAASLADGFRQGDSVEIFLTAELPVVSRALIMLCGRELGIVPEYRHIEVMLSIIQRGSGSLQLPGDHVFRVTQGKIWLKPCQNMSETTEKDKFRLWQCDFSWGEIITPASQKIILQAIDQTKYDIIRKNHQNVFQNSLDYDILQDAIFRFRREGDRFAPVKRGCTKSLKKLFNEYRIPVDQRASIPLLVSAGKIAWMGGFGVAEGFQVTRETRYIVYIQTEPVCPIGSEGGTDIR
ncbi:MAG: tRNA lysidine(34) synthetase TilS [Clostridia bacterium]|nr:tRNA lysidine(34) synthetase TilS [Clostridia bacterium]